MAVARLISAGHVANYKQAKFFAPMGAAALPFVLGRLKRNAAITPGIGDPVEALGAIYTDTILHDTRVLKFVIEMIGTARLMMGSDMPFPIGDHEPMKIVEAAGLSKTRPHRSTADWRRSLFRTAIKMNKRQNVEDHIIRNSPALLRPAVLRPCGAGHALRSRCRRRPPRKTPTKITIVVFSFPSLGAFMPPVIKARNFDTANGLDIEFVERTPDAYTHAVQLRRIQGRRQRRRAYGRPCRRARREGEVSFQPVRLLGHGRHLAAGIKTSKISRARNSRPPSTTNFVMFEFFAKQQGVDISKIQSGQYGTAGPGRLCASRSRRRHPDLGAGLYAAEGQEARHPHARHRYGRTWKVRCRRRAHSLSRLAAHDRLDRRQPGADPEALRDLQGGRRIYRQRIPKRRAALIAPKSTPADQAALVSLIKANDRLGMSVVPARRGRQADRRRLQSRHRCGLFQENALERHHLR